MIFEELKTAFIHIPRTGGNSIKTILGCTDGGSHSSAAELTEKLGSRRPEFFMFAFVRNPWDLMVSGYHFLQHNVVGKKYEFPHGLAEGETFDDWIKRKLRPYENQFGGLYLSRWIGDQNYNILVDFVGKFENLENDIRYVCQRIGIETPEIPHINQSDRVDYREYYSSTTKELVWSNFWRDIDTFEYKF